MGERAGERWCSGLRGRSFLQSIFTLEGTPVSRHLNKKPVLGVVDLDKVVL
jgi:hypothetical protein